MHDVRQSGGAGFSADTPTYRQLLGDIASKVLFAIDDARNLDGLRANPPAFLGGRGQRVRRFQSPEKNIRRDVDKAATVLTSISFL